MFINIKNMEREDKNNEFLEKDDKREFVRFSVDLQLKFLDPNTNKEKEAQVHDINAKGIGILANEELAKDTILEMWIEVSSNEQPLYTKGKVIWSKQIEPNKYRVGISLDKVDLIGIARVLRAIYGPDWL